MSKFNTTTKGSNKITNKSGHVAYKMEDKEKLVTAVLTSMFGEAKYYGNNDKYIVSLATKFAKEDPDFLARLTCYARNVGNMRSISHVLTAIIAREAREYTRKVVHNVIIRPDDILEIMSCYKNMYGKPFPNALKRQIAIELNKFNEYSIAKYNNNNKSLTFKDVLRITHPSPYGREKNELFNKIINDELETPYTWETVLSSRGNTKEVWEELISSGELGYMAKLRNLRNIFNCGAYNYKEVLNSLADPEEVKRSRQLPFRFYSAYRELGDNKKVARPYLDRALEASVQNLPELKGRTLIAVDTSGSMSRNVSRRSNVNCRDIAVTLGCIATHICEDATVVYFSSDYWGDYGYSVAKYGKYDSILGSIDKAPQAGGGTDMSLPMEWALVGDTSNKPFDRVIYLSDNECNYQKDTVQKYIDRYNKEKNTDIWVHAIDMQGYGSQQFIGKKFNLIAGWGDTVLEFINICEDGISNLVDTISKYEMK